MMKTIMTTMMVMISNMLLPCNVSGDNFNVDSNNEDDDDDVDDDDDDDDDVDDTDDKGDDG